MKNNYGTTGAEIYMRYAAGRFVIERSHVTDPIMKRATAKEAFLRLLKKYIGQNRPVGPNSGRNYAPAVFEADPEAAGISKVAFASAMSELLDAGIIYIVIEGPPSHRRSYLAVSQLPATMASD